MRVICFLSTVLQVVLSIERVLAYTGLSANMRRLAHREIERTCRAVLKLSQEEQTRWRVAVRGVRHQRQKGKQIQNVCAIIRVKVFELSTAITFPSRRLSTADS